MGLRITGLSDLHITRGPRLDDQRAAFHAYLDDAIRWFRERGIPLYAVNENPSQQRWTSSPKVHADLYIDDSSLGCPIRFVDGVKRPVADWTRIREQLVREGFLD